ncbi:MAG: hypothetical protein FJ109_12910, partial [Deltaproteobacteria bacterium]|nr:hypothetical protein [Deltaproteobacteria bacterium]
MELWNSGIRTWWDAAVPTLRSVPFLQDVIGDSLRALGDGRWESVADRLAAVEHWRALCCRRDSDVQPLRWLALDIETTGLAPPACHVTVIGLCGHATGFEPVSINADTLDWHAVLSRFLAESDVLVTFNGRRFDVPFLRSSLGWEQTRFPPFHVDLYYLWKRLGERGGLKKIQVRLLGRREGALAEVDGYTAVKLWHAHRRGVGGALETLVRYCLEDVVVLFELARMGYDRAAAPLGRGWRCWKPPAVSLKHLPCDDALVRHIQGPGAYSW